MSFQVSQFTENVHAKLCKFFPQSLTQAFYYRSDLCSYWQLRLTCNTEKIENGVMVVKSYQGITSNRRLPDSL